MMPATMTPVAMTPMTIMPPARLLNEVGIAGGRGLHGGSYVADRCRLGAGRHQPESKRESYC
jgi:hypothetical protein